ncbi:VOC family protein [Dactylosporangium sp. McL0621]|uniref:VOC family protein n=1 Tax=Dactylosporangium sp. McL0621 TaxID=3415678 RepID=UPI003CEFBF78
MSVAREHVQARLAAALAAGGRIVHHWNTPEAWTLADRAGNRVCLCAWPDGAAGPPTPESGEIHLAHEGTSPLPVLRL